MQWQQKQKLGFIAISILAVVVALFFFNPFQYYFLNDDFIHIPLSKDGVLFQRRSFRPVCDLSVRLDYIIWGKNAIGYHLTNLVLHLFNSWLVYLFAVTIFRRYARDNNVLAKGVLVSVLFFIWAFHSEAIFWILGRSGSLGVLFFLPALIFYLKKEEAWKYLILSLVFFVAGLFTYESVWIFPLIVVLIALLDKKYYRAPIRKQLTYIVTVLVLFVAYLVARFNVIGEIAGNYEASNFKTIQPVILFLNFIRLFVRTFAPPLRGNLQFVIACLLLGVAVVIIIAASWSRIKKDKIVILLIVLFIVSLVPYLSLGIDTHGVEGERFLYLPSIFACLLVVQLIFLFAKKAQNQLIIFSLLLMYHLLFLYYSHNYYATSSNISRLTFQQINLVKDKKRLFIDSLPQSNNGALIFRLGFEQGAQWLKESGTVDTVIVRSIKKDNTNWSKSYYMQRTTSDSSEDIRFIYKDEFLEVIE